MRTPRSQVLRGRAQRSGHEDGRTKRYRDDQLSQEQRRKAELGRVVGRFVDAERDEWKQLLNPVLLEVSPVFDRDGKIMPIGATGPLMDELQKTRSRYKRPDGRWQALRMQGYLTDTNGLPVTDEKGRKIRGDLDCKTAVLHEAFEIDPRLSRMVVLAAHEGKEMQELVTEFLRIGAGVAKEAFEKHTGLRVEFIPYHPKVYAGHFQPYFTLVDPEGNKLGNARRPHVGPAMLGAARWRSMGYKGKALDALTGVENSEAGLDAVLQSRGSKSVDYLVQKDLDRELLAWIDDRRFAKLHPFFEKASDDYEKYLARRRGKIDEAETARKRILALEAEVAAQAKALAEARLEIDRDLCRGLLKPLLSATSWVQMARVEGENAGRKVPGGLSDYVEKDHKTHAFGWGLTVVFMNLFQKVQTALGAGDPAVHDLEAEVAACRDEDSVEFVSDAGKAVKLPELLQALQRLAAGKETGEDEFWCDEFGRVKGEVQDRIAVLAKNPHWRTFAREAQDLYDAVSARVKERRLREYRDPSQDKRVEGDEWKDGKPPV